MSYHTVNILIDKLTAMGEGSPEFLHDVLGRCMREDLWPSWVEQITAGRYTLDELAKLGHPYSTRYGTDSFTQPDAIINQQEGVLLGASSIQETADGFQITNTSDEYVYLRYGTRLMRMRDPGGGAFDNALPKIKKRFATEIKDAIVNFDVS